MTRGCIEFILLQPVGAGFIAAFLAVYLVAQAVCLKDLLGVSAISIRICVAAAAIALLKSACGTAWLLIEICRSQARPAA